MQTNLSGHFLPVKTYVKKPQKSLHSFGQNFKNKYYHTVAGLFLLKAYKGQTVEGQQCLKLKMQYFQDHSTLQLLGLNAGKIGGSWEQLLVNKK